MSSKWSIDPTSSKWTQNEFWASSRRAQNELRPSKPWAKNELKMSFGHRTDEPKMSSKWALAVKPMSQKWAENELKMSLKWAFWAQKLILSSFSAHFRLIFGSTAKAHFELIFGSLVGRPKLILSSFLAHRFDGRNSFWAHFWLIGSMWKAHFEVVSELFRRHFWLICGSFLRSQVFCAERVQIVSLPKLVWKRLEGPHWRLQLGTQKGVLKGPGHGVSTNRFCVETVEGLNAPQEHSSVEIVSHKLESPAFWPFNLPSTFAWPRQMVPEPLLDPGSWLQGFGLARANGSRAFAWPRLKVPEPLPDPWIEMSLFWVVCQKHFEPMKQMSRKRHFEWGLDKAPL